jgi:hypothetical protein
MFIVRNKFVCVSLPFFIECSVISAVPQLAAGGISNSADMANIGPGGSGPPQQRYVSVHVVKMKQFVGTVYDYPHFLECNISYKESGDCRCK